MTSIGPQIPAHLLTQYRKQNDDNDNNEEPHTPSPELPSYVVSSSTTESQSWVYHEDDVGPRLEPELSKDEDRPSESHSISGDSQGKRVLGPSIPLAYDSDSSDDDIGPKPLRPGTQHKQPDAVKDFMEKEEKRRKAIEEASKPKPPKREEWMLVPPTTSGLLGKLDPTKLKGRQFSRGSTSNASNDMSLWTETPAERQQRLADEVSGKKRRVTDRCTEDDEELHRKRQRKQEEEAIRNNINNYTRARRGPALVEQHTETLASKPSEREQPVIWDHSRDMAIGGRLMDDEKRSRMLKDARGLGEKFSSGSGGFL